MKEENTTYSIIIILLTGAFMILLCLMGNHVSASGYIRYDEIKEFDGHNYYMYNLPPRANNDFMVQTRAIFYKGHGGYSNYQDRYVMNNQYVKNTWQQNMQYNNENLMSLVTNPFTYGVMPNGTGFDLYSNQAYLSLIFSPGEPVNTTDDMFYDPYKYKGDGYYDFDFDIYQLTTYRENAWSSMEPVSGRWLNQWMVKYNLQGNYCMNKGNINSQNCFVDRYSGSYSDGAPAYTKTTYHVTHGKFAPSLDTISGDVPTDVKNSQNTGGAMYDYIYSFTTPFQVTSVDENGLRFVFYVSTPYNIKYYGNEASIFLNGDRVTNTDDINYAVANSCYDADCQTGSVGTDTQNMFYQLFNIDLINLHGFGEIIESVRSLFTTILTRSTSCKTLDFNFNVRNHNVVISLPCGYDFWRQNGVASFKVVVDLVINGLVTYVIFLKFYHELLKLADPNYAPTNKEVMEL